MKLAFDVYYYENKAKTVAVCFKNWSDVQPDRVYSEILENVEEYQPGKFYKKELPCIISLLKQINIENITEIIVDSFVILDDKGKNGLGGYLYEHLERKIPVIGVAKSDFVQNKINKQEIYRGLSKKPLYISALGIGLELASKNILNMEGEYRMPTLLKYLDTMTKEIST